MTVEPSKPPRTRPAGRVARGIEPRHVRPAARPAALRRCLPLLALLPLVAVSPAVQAADERLSVDWLFSDEGKAARTLPEHAWFADGTLVVYDTRRPPAERTFERVDPRSGRRRALLDADDAIAELNRVVGPDEPIDELGWPAEFSPDGRHAVYEIDGDLYLLDIARTEVRPVAVSEAAEEAPRFSPDGRLLAFVRANDLYLHALADGAETRLTRDGSETLKNGTVSWVYWEELLNRSNRGYSWAPDSSAIAYLQSDESMVGEMHYVDFEPSLPAVIHQRHPKAGSANPRVRAGVVRVDDAKTTWVDLGTYPHEYLARVQWLPDSRRLAVQALDRTQTRLDVFLVTAASGEARHLFRETNDGWVNVHDDLHFLPDAGGFVWLSARDGHAHLYLSDTAGQVVRPLTRGEWALKSSGGPSGMDRAVARLDADSGWAWFTALEKDSTERHLYRVRLDGSGFERLTREDGSHAIWFAPGGERYLAQHSSFGTPPSLALYAADGARLATVAAAASDHVERFGLQAPELFSVRAEDGYAMPATLQRPRDFDPAKRYPVVIYVYAGPSAPTVTNAWSLRARSYFHQLLLDDGIVVFQVDNRSAAGRSKSDANVILEQLYGPVELGDLLDAVDWLKAQPWVDGERVGIWGWSGGGTMTLSAMTGSDEFAAGVAVAGVTDWRYYDTIYTERYMRRPDDNPDGYALTSLVEKAANLHGRLLLVHGTYDDNVHPQNTWAFADELIGAGILFDMLIYPMRKHGIADDAAQAHLYRSMREFWRREFGLAGD